MFYKYGDYDHDEGEVRLATSASRMHSNRGTLIKQKITHQISGRLRAADSATLKTKQDALQTAYVDDQGDAGLYYDSAGVVPSGSVMVAANTLGGIIVEKPPSFPRGGNAQYGVFLDYEITLSAIALGSDNLITFIESVDFSGGLRNVVFLKPIDGSENIKQLTGSQHYEANQSGSAMTKSSTSPIPAPLFPDDLVKQKTGIDDIIVYRGQIQGYKWKWSYQFAREDSTFSGFPNSGL